MSENPEESDNRSACPDTSGQERFDLVMAWASLFVALIQLASVVYLGYQVYQLAERMWY